MESEKKILLIHHGVGVGGGLIALLSLIEELLKNNNEITVFTVFPSEANLYIKKLGVNVITPKSWFYSRFYTLFVVSAAEYNTLISVFFKIKGFLSFLLNKYYFSKKEFRNIYELFDVLYLNSTFLSDFSFYFKNKHKKVIIHVREPIDSKSIFYSFIRKNINKNCDQIYCITKDNALRLNLKYKSFIKYDKIFNRGTFSLIEQDKSLKYFVYVGGEIRIKGFEQLVKSLKFLRSDVRIYFLGSQVNYKKGRNLFSMLIRKILFPFSSKIDILREELHKSDKIIYVGLTDDVFSYFQSSEALICPFSKPHAALPIFESFYCGKPVIISDVQGSDEFVKNNFNGFIFKNGIESDLARAINEFANLDDKQKLILRLNAENSYREIFK